MELIGYVEPFNLEPGDAVELRVSTSASEYECDVVRLIHGDTNPAGPGFKLEEVEAIPPRRARGRLQASRPGSYGRIRSVDFSSLPAFTVAAWVLPTLPAAGRDQSILAAGSPESGWKLVLGADQRFALVLGSGGTSATVRLATRQRMAPGRWHLVAATADRNAGTAALVVETQPEPPGARDLWTASAHGLELPGGTTSPLLIGAAPGEGGPTDFFNGKIEAPRLHARSIEVPDRGLESGLASLGELAAEWDLALDPSTNRVEDLGPDGHHGELVNGPTRAVTGHAWTGEVLDFKADPSQYGAVHFHEDDVLDVGWETDLRLSLPEDLGSGIYAVRLRAGDRVDHVPFFVRPPDGGDKAPMAFLVPTLTYLAYANERLIDRRDYAEEGIIGHPIEPDPGDRLLAEHTEYGSSLYDVHRDGSGVCYTSARRPIPNLRPDYRMWRQNAPRHLGADLYIVDWLEHKGFHYDVLTDHDLEERGPALLDDYGVVVTGSHPEYYTARMRAGIERFTASGGQLIYLGGNGFYWVTSVDPARPWVAEVRRGVSGTGTWESAPGEGHHSTTGEPGGLWRNRGLAPNKLVGIGFTAQGWDEPAPGFTRTGASRDARAEFIFEGVDEEIIGDFGLVMNGASGDELDRTDVELGTPGDALVVASARGHSEYYQPAFEEVPIIRSGRRSRSELIRSDMTYLELDGGGAVFAVGSIAFSGSLSHNGYENNVSRITQNVLRRFLKRSRGSRAEIAAGACS